MSFKIYYHPSAKVEFINIPTNTNKNNNNNIDYNKHPIEYIKIRLDNKDENLQHLPDMLFYNLPDILTISIKKDGSIRSDRCLNFIKDSIYEGKRISLFLCLPSSITEIDSETIRSLQVVSLGDEFEIANKHTPSSPVQKNNKPLFIESFFEYAMPNQTATQEQFSNTLLKF